MKSICASLLLLATMAAPAIATPPVQLYTLNCWGCHQPHAEGIAGTVPRLAHSMGYFLNIPEGRAYLAQVPGVANSPLRDNEIADVLNWLLQTFNHDELPKDFKLYTVDEIRALRPHPLVKVKERRAELAKHLGALGFTVAPLQ